MVHVQHKIRPSVITIITTELTFRDDDYNRIISGIDTTFSSITINGVKYYEVFNNKKSDNMNTEHSGLQIFACWGSYSATTKFKPTLRSI